MSPYRNPICKKLVIPPIFVSKQGGMAGKTIDESKAAQKLMYEKKRQDTDSSMVPVTGQWICLHSND
jgi:hypothetical protein